ncbi:MAG: cellulase family glycosylhydrolase [Chitinispirillaceae bacterium]|jgi:aryl-phospho-beta-D-glucosidase BglC (GH1 family)
MRRAICILFTLSLTGTIWSADEPLHQGSSSLSWLKVDGKFIIDTSGTPLRLIGHGISPINPSEWAGKSIDQIVVDYKAKGCNSMRVAFYRNNGHDQTRDQIKELGVEKFIDQWIQPQVEAIIKNGMYAIIDWHGYQNQHEFLYSELIPLWAAIAKRYKDEPGVAIYELWNEPSLGKDKSAANSLRTWYKDAITAIRAIDSQHIIMVSDYNAGWGWATEPMWAPDGKIIDIDPLKKNQIVYSKHMAVKNEKNGDGQNADNFSNKYDVPVFWGEVETDPKVVTMELDDQHIWFQKMVERILKNGLYQGMEFWRIYHDVFEDDWRPLLKSVSPKN